jgi:hypothetical protein
MIIDESNSILDEQAHLEQSKLDERYPGGARAISEFVASVLKDSGARLIGTPHWPREDDADLYDAITCLRDSLLEYRKEDFNIGGSYIRYLNTWLSSNFEYNYFVKMYDKPGRCEVASLDVIDRRVREAIAKTNK